MSTPPSKLTRQQRYMILALEHIQHVDRTLPRGAAKIYGGLCHNFPVLVRTAGLCQALAFVEAKTSGNGDRSSAYRELNATIAAVLGTNEATPLETVRTAPVTDYMHYTRTILSAWIFYKRFAVSVLDVESAQAAEPGDDE